MREKGFIEKGHGTLTSLILLALILDALSNLSMKMLNYSILVYSEFVVYRLSFFLNQPHLRVVNINSLTLVLAVGLKFLKTTKQNKKPVFVLVELRLHHSSRDFTEVMPMYGTLLIIRTPVLIKIMGLRLAIKII